MGLGNIKAGEDRYNNKLQFAHLRTDLYVNVSAGGTYENTGTDRAVVLTPTVADAWIKIEGSTPSPATDEGFLLPAGGSYTTILRAGEHIGSTAVLNIVPLGEI